MRVLIQKFGGTSVGTEEGRLRSVAKVVHARQDGYDVVVVVSAMGRSPEPYATDSLAGLLNVSGDLMERERDLLLSCGETISAVVFAGLLASSGVGASALTGSQAGIVTDCRYGDARIRKVDPDRVLHHLQEGRVVVVAGFQGATEDGEITTLGRGGSDVTAAALGCALAAERVEIFTDVDGIMTADPRLVPGAAKVRRMTYREVCEMAHLGAGVIHPRAAEIAMEGGVPLWIKNTFTDDDGTLIADRATVVEGIPIHGDQVVSGIACIRSLAQVKVRTEGTDAQRSLAVLQRLADEGISLDLINVSPDEMSFTIRAKQARAAGQVLSGFDLDSSIEEGFAKVSAVGAGMRGVPGVMARIVEALTRVDVEIYQTSDSHTSISCLVRDHLVAKALSALHEQFGLADVAAENMGRRRGDQPEQS